MEETLGKRIVAGRKRLGITQDRLAEQLGVTAQAVSKWENDQSCPDITMLPKLADIFGCSVDALLGVTAAAQDVVHEAEVITAEAPEENEKNSWEFHWDSGRKDSIGLASWVLLVGGLMLLNIILRWNVSLWDIIWPSAVMMFGLLGLYPKFSFFRVGCSLFGAYFLLENLHLTNLGLSGELVLPIVIILFGLSLLADAIHKPNKPHFTIINNGKVAQKKTVSCTMGEDSFDCDAAFCENQHLIDLSLMRRGNIDVSFGELTVDLTGCKEFAEVCHMNADCAFGNLTILIPARIRAEVDSDAAFGSVDIRGEHDRDASTILHINADVSFGQITVKYI